MKMQTHINRPTPLNEFFTVSLYIMRNEAHGSRVITNCLLIRRHWGHLWIIRPDLNVSRCASLVVYLCTEGTPLSGQRGRVWVGLRHGSRPGRREVAKTWGQTIKREEVKIKREAKWVRREREIKHFTLMSNSYTFFIFCLFSFLQASKHEDKQHHSAALHSAVYLKHKLYASQWSRTRNETHAVTHTLTEWLQNVCAHAIL